MKRKSKESSRHVKAALNALSILDCFQTASALSLRQISEATKLNKTRIMRLCGTLESDGYLVHDLQADLYKLGSKLLLLGKVYEKNNDLISAVRPILKDLARETGESPGLFIVDRFERVLLAREDGPQSLRYTVEEGQRMPLYAGAGGKVLLAFGPENLRRKFLKKNVLKRYTNHTILDPKILQEELNRVRQQGYAFSHGERAADVGALAAPVYNHEKRVCAALGIAGPITRFTPEHQARHLGVLLRAAEQLSQALGGIS